MDYQKYFSRDILAAGEDITLRLLDRVFQLREAGVELTRMDMGIPDVPCPPRVTEAAKAALERGENAYTNPAGIPELRQAISDKYLKEQGLFYDPKDSIIVTCGASEAMMTIVGTFLSSGDEVIIPTPGYCSYFFTFTAQGFKIKQVPIVQNNKVNVDVGALEAAITPAAKMIVVNSPQNPTGLVYSKEQLEKIADLAIRYDLLVLLDECYEKFVWEGEYTNIATLPGMQERTLIMNSVSKTYGMTGWRVGFILGPAECCSKMQQYHGNGFVCAAAVCQYGAAAAIAGETPEEIEAFRTNFMQRREVLLQGLDEIGVLPYIKPNGAFYLMVDVSISGMDGTTFGRGLLEEKGVAVFPGEIFGSDYKNYIRLSYACSEDTIRKALHLIKEYLDEVRA